MAGAGCRYAPCMRENASRAAGLTRAVALSWLAVAVSTGAHLIAHGEHPSVPAIAAIHGVVAFFLLPVSLAPFSPVRTFLTVFVAQAGVHVGLTWAAVGEATGSVPLPHLAEHAGHGSAAHVATAAGAGMSGHADGQPGAADPEHGGGPPGRRPRAGRAPHAGRARRHRVRHPLRLTCGGLLPAGLFALAGLRPVVVGPGRSGLARWDAARPRDVWLSRCAAPRGPPAMSRRPRSAVPSSC